jgi:4-hydroxybenzoate polyprenyltransferase
MSLALLKLMRLYYSLPIAMGFIVILSYLTGGNLVSIFDKVILSFFSLLSITSASYVFNDVCDIEIDKINCPHRILAAGRLKRKTALIWSIVLFATGMALGSGCGLAFFLVISAIASLLVCYDLLSKRIAAFKSVLVALLMTSLYPLAFTLTESMQTPRLNVLYIHPVWLFLSSLGYEMLKDIRDIKGDSQVNGRDLYHCTDKRFVIMSRLFIVAGSLVTLLPFMLGYCKQIYLVASIAAIILAIASTFQRSAVAIRYVYAEIFLITVGAMADLLVFGP